MRTSLLFVGSSSLAFVAALVVVAACDNADKVTSQTRTTSAEQPSKLASPPTPAAVQADQAAKAPMTPSPMTTLDADMKRVIDQLGMMGGRPIETLRAAQARTQPTVADAVHSLLVKEGKSTTPESVGKVENRTIATAGGTLPLRVYTPKTGSAPYPVVVYFHGGGFVIATNDTYDASARSLANGAEAIVVSPEYRKGPEARFPAAHDDALATYEWVAKYASTLGGDPKRIAIAGESAGGNLAAATSIALRDKGEPLPVFELLVYPVAGSDMTTASYMTDANDKPLNKAMMGWFTENYFRTPDDAKDPRIDLVNAKLSGLEPTLIINASVDPLRSDGENLATQMKAAGVTVDQKTYAGVTHEFFGTGVYVSKAKDAMSLATSKLKSAFSNVK